MNTEIKRSVGRPISTDSERQKKLKEKQERVAKGETIAKGRPVNENSKRQQRMLEKQVIIEAGGIVRAGRPRKEEVVALS